MQLWQLKLFFDARYFIGEDMLHKFYEVLVLLALATSVLYISTVDQLSDPDVDDMFYFCLSISVAYLLAIGRYVEILVSYTVFRNQHLHEEAFYAARREITWTVLFWTLYVAAAVYSGVQYYGGGDRGAAVEGDGADRRRDRLLAAAVADESEQSYPFTGRGTTDDVPIWLLVGGSLASFVLLAFLVNWPQFLNRWRGTDVRAITVPLNIEYCIHR